jgi:hypothetical protein
VATKNPIFNHLVPEIKFLADLYLNLAAQRGKQLSLAKMPLFIPSWALDGRGLVSKI